MRRRPRGVTAFGCVLTGRSGNSSSASASSCSLTKARLIVSYHPPEPAVDHSMPTETPQPIYLKDYKPPAWLIENLSLDVRLDPQTATAASWPLVKPNPRRACESFPPALAVERLTLQDAGDAGL